MCFYQSNKNLYIIRHRSDFWLLCRIDLSDLIPDLLWHRITVILPLTEDNGSVHHRGHISHRRNVLLTGSNWCSPVQLL